MILQKLVVPICVSVCLLTILHTNREALLDTKPFDSHANITCNNNHTVRGAIVTILTAIDEDYINLVLVLGHSINLYDAVTCDIDRIVMIHDDAVFTPKTRSQLKLAGWSLMIVPQIAPPDAVNKLTVRYERYLKCFSKLHAFNMTQYETVLLLDADTILCGNVMELFIQYATRMRTIGVHLAWARDSRDKSNPNSSFNAGVMLIRPSNVLTHHLIENLNRITFEYAFSEQGYLTAMFNSSQPTPPGSIYRQYLILPQKFNLLAKIATTDNALWQKTWKDARIFHFTWLKPTALFLMPRCAYMGTLRFCGMWTRIRDQLL